MFVKCTNPIMAYLRKCMIDILIYIDDTFLCSPSSAELVRNLKFTMDLLSKCGLTMNFEKSCLTPTTKMEFLGFIIDSVEYSISVTPQKRKALLNLITPILLKPRHSIPVRFLAKLSGKSFRFFRPVTKQTSLQNTGTDVR